MNLQKQHLVRSHLTAPSIIHGLIIGTPTIQYLKSNHLNITLDCAPFCTPPNPNHQLDLFKTYGTVTIFCHFITVTPVQARITSHWLIVRTSHRCPCFHLCPPTVYSPHSSRSKLLKCTIWSSDSSNNNQFPITLRVKSKWPHPAFLSNFISLILLPILTPTTRFNDTGFPAVPGP